MPPIKFLTFSDFSNQTFFFCATVFSELYRAVHFFGEEHIVLKALVFTQKSHPPEQLPVPLKWDILSWGIKYEPDTEMQMQL